MTRQRQRALDGRGGLMGVEEEGGRAVVEDVGQLLGRGHVVDGHERRLRRPHGVRRQ